jgi:hypothetical protein
LGFFNTATVWIGGKIDGVFLFGLAFFVVVLSPRPASGDEPYAKKGHGTSTNKLACIVARSALEVTVKDRRSKDDGQCEEDKLDWNDLRSIEVLQCPVDILDLHNSSADQDQK